jgi:hypothetical protein
MNYNGYTNYQTWATAFWIDNDESCPEELLDQIREAIDKPNSNPYMSEESHRRFKAKECVQQFVEETMLADIQGVNGLAFDLLNSAISDIDWYDLAQHYLSTLKEETQS